MRDRFIIYYFLTEDFDKQHGIYVDKRDQYMPLPQHKCKCQRYAEEMRRKYLSGLGQKDFRSLECEFARCSYVELKEMFDNLKRCEGCHYNCSIITNTEIGKLIARKQFNKCSTCTRPRHLTSVTKPDTIRSDNYTPVGSIADNKRR